MTDHREQIPPLRDADTFRRMRMIETVCSNRTFHYIPKTHVMEMQKRIENGDIIAITTDLEGIDVRHVGIVNACRPPGGFISSMLRARRARSFSPAPHSVAIFCRIARGQGSSSEG